MKKRIALFVPHSESLSIDRIPLTRVYTTTCGVSTQIYLDQKSGHLVGTVLKSDGTFRWLASHQIYNGPSQEQLTQTVVSRLLVSYHPESFYGVYQVSKGIISIWPHLRAAGKGDNHRAQEMRDQGYQEHHLVPRQIWERDLDKIPCYFEDLVSDILAA